VLELASTIKKITDSKSEIVHLPPLPEGDMTRRQPNIEKMQCLLQRPFVSLEDGLRLIIDARGK
ncbi:MAG TPA: hypothetical protein VI548_05475, partial [Chitinophagaceae bacterium]|nr:hypothetical protein [Chitinophagaceae bacterium]